MPEDYFDEPVAATYDESLAAMFDDAVVEPAVAHLAVLAGDGPALDLGIGTGRIALVSNFGGFGGQSLMVVIKVVRRIAELRNRKV